MKRLYIILMGVCFSISMLLVRPVQAQIQINSSTDYVVGGDGNVFQVEISLDSPAELDPAPELGLPSIVYRSGDQIQLTPLNSYLDYDYSYGSGITYYYNIDLTAAPNTTGRELTGIFWFHFDQGSVSIRFIQRKENPGSISPASQTISSGVSAVTLSHTGWGVTSRQWQQSADGTVWSNIAGATAASYSPGILTNTGSDNAVYQYRVRINGTGGFSSTASVVVNPVSTLPSVQVSPGSSQSYTAKYSFRQKITTSPTTITTDQAIPTIVYYDGLGRPIQTVEPGASPLGRDIITPVEYDAFGRGDVYGHLPYAATTGGGQYRTQALSDKTGFYTQSFGSADAGRSFAEKVYESSPLNRPLQQKKPGNVYAGKPEVLAYGSNTGSEVFRITVNASHAFVVSGYHPANTLFKNSVTNEDGLTIHTFTDLLGRTLLKRSTDGSTTLSTYYVYDDFNQLCWVISPEGANLLSGSGTYAPTHTTALNYCYMYEYDARGNVVEKRLPGAESILMAYDSADRPIGVQTGTDRAGTTKYWTLSKYDAAGRLIEQRRVTGNYTAATFTAAYNTLAATGALIAQYYYGNYNTMPSGSTLAFEPVAGIVTAYDTDITAVSKYERVAILDGTTDQAVERAFYYDTQDRLIQTVEKNHLGGISRYSTQYDFIGNVLSAHESHTANGTTYTILTTNEYDHRNRLLTTTTTLNGGSPATVTYTYNSLGQLATKKYGMGTSAVTETLTYNIQGWLTSQSSPRFTMGLDYFDAGKYSGNITKWSWGHGSTTDQSYALTYDAFDRLKSGVHSLAKFNETIGSYDLNGNIQSLSRTANGTATDNFTYTYTGNQLAKINNGSSYAYDANGNMTTDARQNLNFIYNSLNLLQEVRSGSTVKAKYQYLADGTKQQVRDASGTNGYDYLGGLTLVKSGGTTTPEAAFAEGVIRGSEVMFFEKDHLGSVRAVLNSSGQVLERNDYYPFGLRHTNASHPISASNRFKFNGKEDQVTGSLGLLDYGARMYDPQIGRFTTADPMVEVRSPISPFAYCQNNPVMRIDPTGMLDDWYEDEYGNIKWFDKSVSKFADQQGNTYHNIGKSYSAELIGGEGYVNYYQNTAVSTSSVPLDAGNQIINSPSLLGKYLGSSNPLSEAHQTDLMNAYIHKGQQDFIDHPATQTAINGLLFVATGGIEGGISLANWGRGLLNGASKVGASSVDDVAVQIKTWLGNDAKAITNKAGDNVFISKDGMRRVRFDIKNPSPHTSSHSHVEQFVNGKWIKSGPLYPKNVPQY